MYVVRLPLPDTHLFVVNYRDSAISDKRASNIYFKKEKKEQPSKHHKH